MKLALLLLTLAALLHGTATDSPEEIEYEEEPVSTSDGDEGVEELDLGGGGWSSGKGSSRRFAPVPQEWGSSQQGYGRGAGGRRTRIAPGQGGSGRRRSGRGSRGGSRGWPGSDWSSEGTGDGKGSSTEWQSGGRPSSRSGRASSRSGRSSSGISGGDGSVNEVEEVPSPKGSADEVEDVPLPSSIRGRKPSQRVRKASKPRTGRQSEDTEQQDKLGAPGSQSGSGKRIKHPSSQSKPKERGLRDDLEKASSELLGKMMQPSSGLPGMPKPNWPRSIQQMPSVSEIKQKLLSLPGSSNPGTSRDAASIPNIKNVIGALNDMFDPRSAKKGKPKSKGLADLTSSIEKLSQIPKMSQLKDLKAISDIDKKQVKQKSPVSSPRGKSKLPDLASSIEKLSPLPSKKKFDDLKVISDIDKLMKLKGPVLMPWNKNQLPDLVSSIERLSPIPNKTKLKDLKAISDIDKIVKQKLLTGIGKLPSLPNVQDTIKKQIKNLPNIKKIVRDRKEKPKKISPISGEIKPNSKTTPRRKPSEKKGKPGYKILPKKEPQVHITAAFVSVPRQLDPFNELFPGRPRPRRPVGRQTRGYRRFYPEPFPRQYRRYGSPAGYPRRYPVPYRRRPGRRPRRPLPFPFNFPQTAPRSAPNQPGFMPQLTNNIEINQEPDYETISEEIIRPAPVFKGGNMFNIELNPVVGKADDVLYELIERYKVVTTQLMKMIPKRAAKVLVFPNVTLQSQFQRKYIDDMIPDLESYLPVIQNPSGPIVQIPFTDFLIQSEERGRPRVTCRCSDNQSKTAARSSAPGSSEHRPRQSLSQRLLPGISSLRKLIRSAKNPRGVNI